MKNPLVDRSKSYFSGRNMAKTRRRKKTMPVKEEGCCCGWVGGNIFVFTFVTFFTNLGSQSAWNAGCAWTCGGEREGERGA
jgi:hypothetical protein